MKGKTFYFICEFLEETPITELELAKFMNEGGTCKIGIAQNIYKFTNINEARKALGKLVRSYTTGINTERISKDKYIIDHDNILELRKYEVFEPKLFMSNLYQPENFKHINLK